MAKQSMINREKKRARVVAKYAQKRAALKKVISDIEASRKSTISEYKNEKQSLSHQIAESTESDVVGMIGHTVILFRQNPDPERQNIHPPGLK